MAQFFSWTLPAEIDRIYATGDWHIGDTFHDEKAVDRLIAHMNSNPPGVFIHDGDVCRHFPLKHRFQSFDDIEDSDYPSPASQLYRAEAIMEEIDLTEWSIVNVGNHEDAIFKQAGNLFTKGGFCERTGIQYGGLTSYIKIKWPDGDPFFICVCHKTKSNPYQGKYTPGLKKRLDSNSAIRLRDNLANKDLGASDLYIMGHTHMWDVYEPDWVSTYTNTGTHLHKTQVREVWLHKPIWAVNTGSLCKSFPANKDTYAERDGYGPCDIAMADISFAREGGKRIPIIKRVDLE